MEEGEKWQRRNIFLKSTYYFNTSHEITESPIVVLKSQSLFKTRRLIKQYRLLIDIHNTKGISNYLKREQDKIMGTLKTEAII